MTAVGWLPAPAEDLFGAEATAEESYDVLTVDVPPAHWTTALRIARDELGCTYFDWLSAVDEPGTGLRVSAHVVALSPLRRLLLRTTVPHETPVLPSAVGVYAGAAWHERETHEMFGVAFEGHPSLDHLLLPDGFEGHPLRKDFVLAARVAKAWPGAKEPGESDHGGPKRRQMLPPGVPDPNEWGPLKGQLPPAPARPARAAGERPVRRARTAADGSATQGPAAGETAEARPAPRRARSVSQGSASQRAAEPGGVPEAPPGPRRARSASGGPASQRAEGAGPAAAPAAPASGPRRARSSSKGSSSQRADAGAGASKPAEDTAAQSPPEPAEAPRGPDAPWHHARPAFDEPGPAPQPGAQAETGPAANEPRATEAAKGQPAATGTPSTEAAEAAAEAGAEAEAATGAEGMAGAEAQSEGEAEADADGAETGPGTEAGSRADDRAEREPDAVTRREPDAGTRRKAIPDAGPGATPEAGPAAAEGEPGGDSHPGDARPPESPAPDERPDSDERPDPDDHPGGTQ